MTGYWLDCLLAVLLHELAHIAVARIFGLRVKRFGLSLVGPYIVRESGPARANACVALAGPLLNVVLALACWHFLPLFAEINAILGAYNLLPFIPRTDGRHAWNALRAHSKLP